MTHAGRLRPLLPKSGSQMRPEPFQIEPKRRRQKEKENRGQSELLCGPKLLNSHRSAAQRARRQRELAEQIEELLQAKGPKNRRSQAQTLRRKVEEAERRLKFDAVCDPTGTLDQALNKEFEINNPRRENRYRRSRREQTLGSEEYHRLLSVAKQSEREHRQREGNVCSPA
ncbi:hypothetical protein DFH09DRAFT_1214102 [Mycena vulgaris]|nr:hypothetical protein DFH09DRAFT_1214102 [Mycena vulgaris]